MANKQSSKELRGIRNRLDKFMDDSMRYQVEVCIPKTLKKSFLVAHTPAGIKEDRWVSIAYYIVSRVLLSTLNEDFKRTKNGKGRSKRWVSIPIAVFLEMGASKYAVIRKQLLDLEILECDGEYSHRNHETYGYRLGQAFRKQPIKYRTIRSPFIKKILLDRRRADLELAKPLIREIAFVAKGWLNHDHIRLDKDAAREFLGLYRSIMRTRLEKRLSHIHDEGKRDELRTQVENRYLHALHQVKKWGKEPTLSVDDKGGRFYTPLVSLLSPLRNLITFEGQPLVSFDIRNSQPLHLLLLLNKEFWAEDSRLTWSLRRIDADLWQEVWSHPLESAQEAATSLSIEFKKRTLRPGGEPVANTHFAELVLAGNSYEFMVEQFRGKYLTKDGKDRFGTRDLAKREMLKMMYFNSKNPHSDSQAPFQDFRRLFPMEAQVMELLKSRNYRDFSVLLQKLEARVLLHKVCRRIHDHNTAAWFTTIHDSIVTTAEHADLVENTILTTYKDILGAEPRLKKTMLHSDAPFDELEKYVDEKLDKELGVPAEETKQLALTIADIRRWMRERAATRVHPAEEHPYAMPVIGPDIWSSEPNPFEPPKRKLKR